MGIHIRAFDEYGLNHLNNELSRIEAMILSAQAQSKTEVPADISLDSDQTYVRPQPILTPEDQAQVDAVSSDVTVPDTDQTAGKTIGPPSMGGYSPTITVQKDGKHVIVDYSGWPGEKDTRITHYKIYRSTTSPCPITEANRAKTVTADHTVVEITANMTKGVTFSIRVCPFYREEGGKKKEIQGGPSN